MNYTTIDGNIENGLRADIMRCSIENKNLLTSPYSIYIGTGEETNNVAATEEFKMENKNDLMLVTSSGLKNSPVLLNENLVATNRYTSLAETWRSYTIQNNNFKGLYYSNLKLTNNNFSSTELYPSINFHNIGTSSATSIGNSGSLLLTQTDNIQSLRFVSDDRGSLYREKITITGEDIKIFFTFYTTSYVEVNNLTNLKSIINTQVDIDGRFVATGGSPVNNDFTSLRLALQGVFKVTLNNLTPQLRYYGREGIDTRSWTDSDLTITSRYEQLL